MSTIDFDFSIPFDGSLSPSTYSTTTTTTASPLTTGSDADSGIVNTSPMPEEFDTTTIDLDSLDLFLSNMQYPLSNDFDEFTLKLFDENNALPMDNTSTYDSLFSSPINTIEQQPSTTTIPAINNCIKLQTPTPIGASIIKLESINPPIRLIPVTQPAIVPSPPPQSAKRRRAESPDAQSSTLTLEKLRTQYGNLSEEALKKHLRMIKNRESASLSRKRRKEYMDNLDVENKKLTEENERLKKQNAQLLIRIEKLEAENELWKKYTPSPRRSVKVMGIFLLVAFSFFSFQSFYPTNQLGNTLAVYDNPSAIVPSRALLNKRSIESYPTEPIANENPPNYPYLQCVAFINKTHSQRINRDLNSWIQTNDDKAQEAKPVIIPDPKSVVVAPVQHQTRKVARSRMQSTSKGQLEPYRTTEINYEEFVRAFERKNDTLYFISFKRDQLVLPALSQNQTQRPKMSLILPASVANLNKSIHVPTNHIPMMKIDCEVDDTKLVFIQQSHIPSAYRDDLLQYYSSTPQATI